MFKKNQKFEVKNPLVVMFKGPEGEVICHLHPEGYTYQHYGLLVADFVRHIANAFNVKEEAVWEWVDKERYHQTSPVTKVQ